MKINKYLYRLLLLILLAGFFCLFSCQSKQTVVISIVTNNNVVIEPIKGKSGERVNFTMPDVPDNKFDGFYADPNCVHFFGATISRFPETDLTLYAKYTPLGLYKVIFDTDGGTAVKSADVFAGEVLSDYQPENPEKNGFIFDGWTVFTEGSQNLFDFESTMPSCNITLYAKWLRDPSKNYYKFIVGDKIYKEIVVETGMAVSMPDPPKLDSIYVFEGWYRGFATTNKIEFDNAVNYTLDDDNVDSDGAFCIYANYYSKGLIFKGGSITGYTGASNSLVIPWAKDDFLIEEISSYAFASKNIKSAVLPETAKRIGDRSFYHCTDLQSVNLPSAIESIGLESFSGCISLQKIDIPKAASINLDDAFVGCYSLKTINFEEGHKLYQSYLGGVYSSDGDKFVKCAPGLSEFSVKKGTRSIERYAFDSAVLVNLTIPDSVTEIARNAIKYEASALRELSLPAVANSQYIKNGQKINIFNLAAIFGAERYSDNIGENIYLNSLFVPATLLTVNITSISAAAEISYSFYGCFYIKNITLPKNGLKYLGAGTFFLCYNLEEIVIPNTVLFVSGGSIANAVFYYCNNLKRITLPFLPAGFLSYMFGAFDYKDTLNMGGISMPYTFFIEEVTLSLETFTEIEEGAFYGNKSLRKIKTDSQIKKIGFNAFYDCNMLEQIDGLQYVKELSVNNDIDRYSGAFAYCYNLKNLSLPKLSGGVIGKEAFLGMGSLSGQFTFTVGDGVKAIEDYAFMDCVNLTGINISSKVTYIGVGAFYNCAFLKKITVPDSVLVIAPSAFENCVTLEALTLPMHNNVEFLIADKENISAFFLPILFGAPNITGNKYKAGNIDAYYVPRSLKTVSFNYYEEGTRLYYSFYNCEFIENIALPDALTDIGENAFYGCASLKSMNLSQNIENIGGGVFSYCKNIASFYINDLNAFYTVVDGVLLSFDKTVLISYPAGRRAESYKVPSTVTHIADFAFAGNGYLKNVELPALIESVGASIFQNCTAVSSVTTTSGIYDALSLNNGFLIGKTDNILYAYFGLNSQVIIPDFVTRIEPYVFSNLKYLAKIVVGKGVISIGKFAFEGISAEVEFDAGICIEEIGNHAFYGYLGRSITMPDTLKSIGNNAFENSSLEKISLTKNIVRIGEYAFFNSVGLSELIIPKNSSLKSIDEAAFARCSLKVFDLPSNLVSIGDFAFAYNRLEFFDSVNSRLETVGAYAFYANSLQTVKISGTVETISEGAFAYNAPLYNLIMEEGIKRIEAYAFNADIRPFGAANPLCMLNIINIPSSIEYIGDMAFYGIGHYATPTGEEGLYWYFTNEIKIIFSEGSLLKEIGEGAFKMVRLAATLDLSMTELESIGAYAFANFIGANNIPDNNSLKKVILPESLACIGTGAFLAQVSLEEVLMPIRLEVIGDEAFYLCSNLSKVFLSSETPPVVGVNAFPLFTAICVPDNAYGIYIINENWQDYAQQIIIMNDFSHTFTEDNYT